MRPVSDKRHRFPPEVTHYVVWRYFRYTFSLHDVEDLLAKRGIVVSSETVRCWTRKFGRQFARNLRFTRRQPTATWHFDDVMVGISGRPKMMAEPNLRLRCNRTPILDSLNFNEARS